MIIDEKYYLLKPNNYVKTQNKKKTIFLANTFNEDMRHYIGWVHRFAGNYKKTAAFTIKTDGVICKHFNPKYKSYFFNDEEINNRSIVILLENYGWLHKNKETDEFITLNGYIYNKIENVIDRKWRGFSHWVKYTEEQLNSAVYLCEMLSQEFDIPLNVPEHNTKIDDLNDYKGILYRSNLDKYYTDLNPSWDFKSFKERICKQ
jgi:N-acetyl-anhydromuramyl-L-alanine amidase AmpD